MRIRKETKRFLAFEMGEVEGAEPFVLDEVIARGELFKENRENEPQLARDLQFHHLAEPYSKVNRYNNPVEKAKVLADFYNKFSAFGSQPLFDSRGVLLQNPGYIGKIFDEVFGGVAKRLGYVQR